MSVRENLATFFLEKQLPSQTFEVECVGPDGPTTHLVDSEFVQTLILDHCSPAEQRSIRDVLVRIDFVNGNVNHFLRHLAEGYVKTHYGSR